MKLLFNWLVYAVAIFLTSYFLQGVHVDSFVTALIVAVVLGVVNTFLRPLLVILTLPINILTLGLFTFVLNAALILLVAHFVPGFFIANFWTALIFSIIFSIIHGLLNMLKVDE